MNNIRIDNSSKIIGKVRFGKNTYIAQGTIIRSHNDSVTIGNSSRALENSVVVGRPARVIRTLNENDENMIKRMRSNDISLDEFVENIFEYEGGESTMSNLYEFNGKLPKVDDSAYIDNLAEITGDVVIGPNSYIGSGVRIIGNSHGPNSTFAHPNVKLCTGVCSFTIPPYKFT